MNAQMTRWRNAALLVGALAFAPAALLACSDDDKGLTCPDGTVRIGDACVPVDDTVGGDTTGADAVADATPGDAIAPDAADTSDATAGVTLPFAIDDWYGPSGYFPEAEANSIAPTACPARAGDERGLCHGFTWTPVSEGFAGVWWQYPDGNWGDAPGLEVPAGATAITFWAWGADGGESVEFVSGYPSDGYEATTGAIELTTTPTAYTLFLTDATYTDIAGGFGWVATEPSGGGDVTIYIDDIVFTDAIAGAGCTDPAANNYDPDATVDDGSCTYDVVTLPFAVDDYYAASGYFPEGEAANIDGEVACPMRAGDEQGLCHGFTWTPGAGAFAGVWWQHPDGNWGDGETPGLELEAGATKITFWAWGATGGEKVDFFAGYARDGFERRSGVITLTTTPTEYEINLIGTSYTDVAGGFGWVTADGAVTFYVDDIAWTDDTGGEVLGCTNPIATNYDPDATVDNGTCTYDTVTLPFALDDYFVASGFFDSEAPNISDDVACPERAGDQSGTCHGFTWTPGGGGFAGVFWQFPANNWGDLPGLPIEAGATKITFWAWGASGGEQVEFFAGYGPNSSDAFETRTGYQTLAATPTKYTLDLTGVTYSDVRGGFGWVTNNGAVTIYIDDIVWTDEVTTGAGCMDDDASNYDASATSDDGSCVYAVTFTVDMSDVALVETDVVFVSGSFQGALGQGFADWCGGCTPLTEGADDVWSVTVDVPPGTYEYKYQVNEWQSDESVPSACGVTNGGFTNRPLTVDDAPVALEAHKWGACPGATGDTCEPTLPELTVNGGFEAGDTSCWTDFSTEGNGTFAATMDQAADGTWSGHLVATGAGSAPVVKQANLGIGEVTPGMTVTVSLDLYGSVAGDGGVFFVEFFSEIDGGGTSKAEILGSGPLFPNGTWTNYTFTTTTGADVSAGVTLQLKADCGGNANCVVDAYIDNVSVTVGGGTGGDAPTEAAPTPTRAAADVTSVFSDAYDDLAGTNLNPNWSQTTVVTTETIAGDATLKYSNFNYQGIELAALDLASLGRDSLHVDVWTADDTSLNVFVLSPGGAEVAVPLATTGGEWTSFDIPLAQFSGTNLANVYQFKFDGGSGNTVYLDNLYFFTDGGGEPAEELWALTFDDAASITGWTREADAAADGVVSWADGAGNPDGAVRLQAANPSAAAGKAYIFKYTASGVDFDGATDVEVSFDIKLAAPLASAALHLGISVPGPGFSETLDIQNQGVNQDTWTTLTYELSNVSAGADTFFVQFNMASGAIEGAGGDLLIDNLRLVKVGGLVGGGCTDPFATNYDAEAIVDDGSCTYPEAPTEAAPTPTRPAANVSSVFSGAYDDLAGTDLNPNWGQSTVVTTESIAGDDTLKYSNFNYQGIQLAEVDLAAAGRDSLHLDFWTSNATTINVYVLSVGGPEVAYALPVEPARWVSVDIPLSTFTGVDLSKVHQFKFDGGSGGTVFLDNIYFYTDASTPLGEYVFDDDYAAGISFAAFGGSTNALSVDTSESHIGSASLKIEVPGAEGSYTGGTFLAPAPADASAYNAVTFWAKASVAGKNLNGFGLGNDNTPEKPFEAETRFVDLSTTWTQYVIPIPDAARLTDHVALFHFAEGSDQGAYTIWLDEIRYASLDDVFTNPRPTLPTASLVHTVGDVITAPAGGTLIVAVDGTDQDVVVGGGYFSLISADDAVVLVTDGVAEAVGAGATTLTATLAGVAALGVLSVDVTDDSVPCVAEGDELTINGGFETGTISCWQDFSAVNNGLFEATMDQAKTGDWSGHLVATGPGSFPVIKQPNLGVGTVTPNISMTISFDLYGSVSGAGGVFFAEFFSELDGGGTSKAEILGGGPLFPNGTWTNYTFTTTTGTNVDGGVTLQFKADCGGNVGCVVDAYIDNVSVTITQ